MRYTTQRSKHYLIQRKVLGYKCMNALFVNTCCRLVHLLFAQEIEKDASCSRSAFFQLTTNRVNDQWLMKSKNMTLIENWKLYYHEVVQCTLICVRILRTCSLVNCHVWMQCLLWVYKRGLFNPFTSFFMRN